ncbi:MAG: hypothetical protein A7316_09780 [Candidatus Altiarchaeales archaeon WOR_SM1_86-2]|nr:MAG: hypothetical protein A7316_09780 [Candidatus Altiarchaeales archaeon WOR_SM1_86-2]
MPALFESPEHKTTYVTISRDEYESMKRTIEILGDEEAMRMIKESRKAINEGRVKSLDDLAKERGLFS